MKRMTTVRRWDRLIRLICVSLCIEAGTYTQAFAIQVEVSEAPDNDLSLTVSAIHSAKKSLLLNIYELTSPDIADALTERIEAGVQVEILEEGQPVGGLSAAGRGIQAQLVKAMQGANSEDHFFEMTSKATGKHRRFRFDHAKYAVIDDLNLLVGSENYSPTGNPQPQTLGNRGWEVLIHDPALAKQFKTIFLSDSDVSSGDLLDLIQESRTNSAVAPHTLDVSHSGEFEALKNPMSFNASAATKITSPDTSLTGLVALLDGAKESIDLEMMTFYSYWKKQTTPSPLLDAVLAAARRGVRVRVLLNDESVFAHSSHPSKPKNQPTVDSLNKAAADEGLDLSARVADIKAMGVTYIHNKGVLVDNDKTLISSINWDENAVMHNREAAVVLVSQGIHDHYQGLFEKDWKASAGAGRRTLASVDSHSPLFQGFEVESFEASSICPTRLHVHAKIGALSITDREDATFRELSRTTIEGDFVRSSETTRVCILSEEASRVLSTGRHRYIQIRERTDGSHSIALEGYTSKGKVYSIRTALDPQYDSIEGDWSASFFDGSGPSKQKLGEVSLEFSQY